MPTIGFLRGSLAWHMDQLQLGEELLIPDGAFACKKESRLPRLEITKSRVRNKTGKDFYIRTCLGHEHAIGSPTFRFYKITRTK